MLLLTSLLTLLLTILFIATCSYCAPDDLDSCDKCDFDRLLTCIQHSHGVRNITSNKDFKLSFRCKCSAKTFRFSVIHHRLYVLKRHVCEERRKEKTGWTIMEAGKDRSCSFQVADRQGTFLYHVLLKLFQGQLAPQPQRVSNCQTAIPLCQMKPEVKRPLLSR